MNNNFLTSALNPLIPQFRQLKPRWQTVLSITKIIEETTLDKQLPKQWKRRVALSFAGIISIATPAQALNFNITYAPGTTQEQIEAVELAAGIWSSYLTDNITANFHFQMTNDRLPSTSLAGAVPAIQRNIDYSDFQSAAIQEANEAGQTLSLPESESFQQLLQDGTIGDVSQMMLTRANAKALGIDITNNTTLDGYIQVSSSTNWDYNYQTSTDDDDDDDDDDDETKYNFVSAVLHEIGHNLGFISGLDASDNQDQSTALDLFRYSTESASVGAIDFSIGTNAYFSLDGGQTPFAIDRDENQFIDSSEKAYFAKGQDFDLGGDGFQTGHWRRNYNNVLGVMDPVLKKEKVRQISQFDLSLLDAIGWNVDYQANTDLEWLQSKAQERANNAVTIDRSSEVEEMIKQSEIYHIGWGAFGGWWQTSDPADNTIPNAQSVSVPEPNSTLGLLILAGGIGIGTALKRF